MSDTILIDLPTEEMDNGVAVIQDIREYNFDKIGKKVQVAHLEAEYIINDDSDEDREYYFFRIGYVDMSKYQEIMKTIRDAGPDETSIIRTLGKLAGKGHFDPIAASEQE